MPSTPRRGTAFGLLVAAPIPAAIGVYAAVNPGGYIYLTTFAFFAVALSVGMAGVAGRLLLLPGRTRRVVQGLVAALTVMVVLGVCIVSAADDVVEPAPAGIVASSEKHRIMAYLAVGGVAFLRIQSRDGLWSREGQVDLACVHWSPSNVSPEALFDRASFITSDEIEIVTADGQASRVRFDPQTLAPESTLDLCGGVASRY